jgi:hypothetical protein
MFPSVKKKPYSPPHCNSYNKSPFKKRSRDPYSKGNHSHSPKKPRHSKKIPIDAIKELSSIFKELMHYYGYYDSENKEALGIQKQITRLIKIYFENIKTTKNQDGILENVSTIIDIVLNLFLYDHIMISSLLLRMGRFASDRDNQKFDINNTLKNKIEEQVIELVPKLADCEDISFQAISNGINGLQMILNSSFIKLDHVEHKQKEIITNCVLSMVEKFYALLSIGNSNNPKDKSLKTQKKAQNIAELLLALGRLAEKNILFIPQENKGLATTIEHITTLAHKLTTCEDIDSHAFSNGIHGLQMMLGNSFIKLDHVEHKQKEIIANCVFSMLEKFYTILRNSDNDNNSQNNSLKTQRKDQGIAELLFALGRLAEKNILFISEDHNDILTKIELIATLARKLATCESIDFQTFSNGIHGLQMILSNSPIKLGAKQNEEIADCVLSMLKKFYTLLRNIGNSNNPKDKQLKLQIKSQGIAELLFALGRLAEKNILFIPEDSNNSPTKIELITTLAQNLVACNDLSFHTISNGIHGLQMTLSSSFIKLDHVEHKQKEIIANCVLSMVEKFYTILRNSDNDNNSQNNPLKTQRKDQDISELLFALGRLAEKNILFISEDNGNRTTQIEHITTLAQNLVACKDISPQAISNGIHGLQMILSNSSIKLGAKQNEEIADCVLSMLEKFYTLLLNIGNSNNPKDKQLKPQIKSQGISELLLALGRLAEKNILFISEDNENRTTQIEHITMLAQKLADCEDVSFQELSNGTHGLQMILSNSFIKPNNQQNKEIAVYVLSMVKKFCALLNIGNSNNPKGKSLKPQIKAQEISAFLLSLGRLAEKKILLIPKNNKDRATKIEHIIKLAQKLAACDDISFPTISSSIHGLQIILSSSFIKIGTQQNKEIADCVLSMVEKFSTLLQNSDNGNNSKDKSLKTQLKIQNIAELLLVLGRLAKQRLLNITKDQNFSNYVLNIFNTLLKCQDATPPHLSISIFHLCTLGSVKINVNTLSQYIAYFIFLYGKKQSQGSKLPPICIISMINSSSIVDLSQAKSQDKQKLAKLLVQLFNLIKKGGYNLNKYYQQLLDQAIERWQNSDTEMKEYLKQALEPHLEPQPKQTEPVKPKQQVTVDDILKNSAIPPHKLQYCLWEPRDLEQLKKDCKEQDITYIEEPSKDGKKLPKMYIAPLALIEGQRGVFAGELIQPGSYLGSYQGEVLQPNELEQRRTTNNNHGEYAFGLKNGKDIDARYTRNQCAYYNHSYQPNVKIQEDEDAGEIKFYAQKEIKPGEHLLIDYGLKYFDALDIKPYYLSPFDNWLSPRDIIKTYTKFYYNKIIELDESTASAMGLSSRYLIAPILFSFIDQFQKDLAIDTLADEYIAKKKKKLIDSANLTPRHLCCYQIDLNKKKIVESSLEQRINPLMYAFYLGNKDIIDALLASTYPAKIINSTTLNSGNSSLDYLLMGNASISDKLRYCRKLIQEFGANPYFTNRNGYNLLDRLLALQPIEPKDKPAYSKLIEDWIKGLCDTEGFTSNKTVVKTQGFSDTPTQINMANILLDKDIICNLIKNGDCEVLQCILNYADIKYIKNQLDDLVPSKNNKNEENHSTQTKTAAANSFIFLDVDDNLKINKSWQAAVMIMVNTLQLYMNIDIMKQILDVLDTLTEKLHKTKNNNNNDKQLLIETMEKLIARVAKYRSRSPQICEALTERYLSKYRNNVVSYTNNTNKKIEKVEVAKNLNSIFYQNNPPTTPASQAEKKHNNIFV